MGLGGACVLKLFPREFHVSTSSPRYHIVLSSYAHIVY